MGLTAEKKYCAMKDTTTYNKDDIEKMIDSVSNDESLPINDFNQGRLFGRQSVKDDLKRLFGIKTY